MNFPSNSVFKVVSVPPPEVHSSSSVEQSSSYFESSIESSKESHSENLLVSKGSKYAVFWQQKLFLFVSILWMLPFATVSMKDCHQLAGDKQHFALSHDWLPLSEQLIPLWIPLQIPLWIPLQIPPHLQWVTGAFAFVALLLFSVCCASIEGQLQRKHRISFKIVDDTWCLSLLILEKHHLHHW